MKRSVASLAALLLAAALFAGPASAAGAETETLPLHATQCQESAGLETCLRVRGVVHSTERSDGSVHQTFNYNLCITNKVDRKVVSTYCQQRHDTYLLKGEEPQVVRVSSTEDVRSLGETCRVRTVFHFVNGEVRIYRTEFLGNCRVPDQASRTPTAATATGSFVGAVVAAGMLDTDRPRPDGIACESNRAPFDRVPVPR